MRLNQYLPGRGAAPRRVALPLTAVCVMGLAGCDGLLDVKNPNNVTQEVVDQPGTAASLVNGATAEVADGVITLVRGEVTLSDETTWIGSQNAAQEHDLGKIGDPVNEYNNEAFNQMSEGRWLADLAIKNLEGFQADGTLSSPDLLARAYLQGAIAYVYIGDLFDDFVVSDRREAAPPIGPANMSKVYDTAIGYLDKGLAIARAAGNTTRELELLAMRARANHGKAVWAKLNPVNTADPLVFSAAANADAMAALALAPTENWKYQYQFTPTTIENDITQWLTQRFEVRLSDAVAVVDPTNAKRTVAIRLMDPIDDVPAPAAAAIMTEFYSAKQYTPFTVISARELRLILAEGALAQGNVAEAATHLNAIRAADGLTAFNPATQSVSALDLLKHMRRTNLLLMGRRLADQYRFAVSSAEWLATSDAAASPGTFIPITKDEINANCHISGAC